MKTNRLQIRTQWIHLPPDSRRNIRQIRPTQGAFSASAAVCPCMQRTTLRHGDGVCLLRCMANHQVVWLRSLVIVNLLANLLGGLVSVYETPPMANAENAVGIAEGLLALVLLPAIGVSYFGPPLRVAWPASERSLRLRSARTGTW